MSRRGTGFAAGGYRYETNTAPAGDYVVRQYRYGRLLNETARNSAGTQVTSTTYAYDPHSRQQTATDARNGAMTYTYNAMDQVASVRTPAPGNGQPPQVSSNFYSSMGRLTNIVHADLTVVTNEYFVTGLLKKTSGSRTYPVEYTYDTQGRMKTMKTWQDFAGNTGTATTTWNYDQYRGFLSGKVYADSTGPTYTYWNDGKLKTRTWARGVVTTYNYTGHGDLYTITYSDTTPSVTYAYDRRGRRQTVTRNNITSTFGYGTGGELLSEAYTGTGSLTGLSVTNAYDTYLRRSSLIAAGYAGSLNGYTYDTAGRLSVVTDGTNNATYSYLANSRLVSQIAFKQTTTTRMTTSKQYDLLNRLQAITSTPSGSGQLPFHFATRYNDANQRVRVNNGDGSYWIYQYDSLGQVKSGKKYFEDGTAVNGQQFEYTFDDIGNRKSTRAGGDQTGSASALRSGSYAVNSVNQYTTRTNSPKADVIGLAAYDATVSVNGVTDAFRRSEYFRKELTLTNNTYPLVTVIASSGANSTTNSGSLYVPPATETFVHDSDGNLVSDGRWTNKWDAENRLILSESLGSSPSNSWRKVEYEYDHQSRRIRKKSYTWNGSTYALSSDLKFLYDGWNLLAELNGASANALVRSYLWGLDLSGSLQDAGGVGGLLKMAHNVGSASHHFAAYDLNGNVAGLTDASNGNVSAVYEYDPFGQTIRSTGAMAGSNPMRFSTKYQDAETDWLYYGYRYYVPQTGRWLGRDPIEEKGGVNTIAFAANNAANLFDSLGLQSSECASICAELRAWPDSLLMAPGGVICKGLTKCPCYRPNPVAGDPTVGSCPDYEAIILKHETGHLQSVTCNECDEKLHLGWYDPPDGDLEECRLRRESIREMEAALPNQTPNCRAAMQKAIEKMKEDIADCP